MSQPAASHPRSTFAILTRLFLDRFLENDLISPGSDRHDTLAITMAVLVSISIFVAFFITTKYLSEFVQLPGRTALSALSDRYFLIAFSMTITALVTLLVWDALGLEPRDGAILGPLPLATGEVARAKLSALLLFAAGFSVAFNAATSVLYPVLMTEHFQLRVVEIARVVAAHAASVMLASAFAFLSVLAIRGVLQATVSERWFGRVSAIVQTALIVLVTSALLLLPVMTPDVSRDWMRADAAPTRRVLPPMWFLGLCATLEGHTIVDTAIVAPHGFELPAYMFRRNDAATTQYKTYDETLAALAARAMLALAIVSALAVATYAWNSRRLPLPTMPRAGRRLTAIAGRRAGRVLAQRPVTRAAFSFTLQVLFRSPPHRVALSVALAVGLTAAIVLAQAAGARGFLAAQLAVVGALVGGFRHAARLPATLPANWIIQMAWRGEQRPFLAGAKRAAAVALIAVPVVALAPMYVAVLGWRVALAHAVVSALAGTTLLHALFIGFRQVPFASPYVSLRNPKLLWPISYAALFLVPSVVAAIEGDALTSVASSLALIATFVALAIGAAIASNREDAAVASLVFEELPEDATQRLGLSARMVG